MSRRGLAVAITHAVVVAGALALVGCKDSGLKTFKEPVTLAGGKQLAAAELNDGHDAFMLYCYGCHGQQGDGRGPASATMRPPPRDFRQGLFKFAGTSAGMLPPDSALDRTIRRGLHGTPMLPWDIPEKERKAIIAYVKTLSPRWKEEEPGEPTEIAPDPWKGRDAEAIERGKGVYHVTALCSSCHPGYATKEELISISTRLNGEPIADFPEELHRSTLRETEYPLTFDEKGEPAKMQQQLPPDFLFHRIKTAYPVGAKVDGKRYTDEAQREDLYLTIASGVGGAAMPQWKGALEEEDLWALVYYVQSIAKLRGTAQALELRKQLELAQAANPTAPATPAMPEGAAPSGGAP